MRFRPCIDIHNGAVKQIVGGTLNEDQAQTNFESEKDAAWFACLYRKDGLRGGHVILLNGKDSPYYERTRCQALSALKAYPKGLQVGGGITDKNAGDYLKAGAEKVIVTSFIFREGKLDLDHLKRLETAVGKEQVVLDLSCRKKGDAYFIVTDHWQTFTDVEMRESVLDELSSYCSEFLIHGVDAEGKSSGMERELVKAIRDWDGLPITYAGGIGSLSDLKDFEELSGGKLDFTVGSALDLFGGSLPYEELKAYR